MDIERQRAKRREISKRHYAKNGDAIRKKRKTFREANPERIQQWRDNYTPTPNTQERNRKKARDYTRHRRELLNTIAMHYGCQNPNCPSRPIGYMPEELDFHHLENKGFSISQGLTATKAKLVAEINKCIVLCSNCHRRVHAERFQVNASMLCRVNDELKPVIV